MEKQRRHDQCAESFRSFSNGKRHKPLKDLIKPKAFELAVFEETSLPALETPFLIYLFDPCQSVSKSAPGN